MENKTITITFCDQAENHVGMSKLGSCAENGFSLEDLFSAKKWFEKFGLEAKIFDLNYPIEDLNIYPDDEAYLLIVRNGVSSILGDKGADNLMSELLDLSWDEKALMYGRVVNKYARHNLCFGDIKQKPNYVEGKGTIVSFSDLPLLKLMRKSLSKIIGLKDDELVAEGNYYYDASKCGIGYHGDAERLYVIGIRLGATIPLTFQWYYNGNSYGQKMRFDLDHGDIYIMSEKTTGNDWRRKTIYTLRHAAGCEKYI